MKVILKYQGFLFDSSAVLTRSKHRHKYAVYSSNVKLKSRMYINCALILNSTSQILVRILYIFYFHIDVDDGKETYVDSLYIGNTSHASCTFVVDCSITQRVKRPPNSTTRLGNFESYQTSKRPSNECV